MLFIDVKSDADSTYEALRNVLKKYKSMSTTFSSNSRNNGLIVAVISGNRSLQMMEHEKVRYTGYDGRIDNLHSDIPATIIPIISDKWTEHFTWKGEDLMLSEEKQKLENIVEQAHSRGQRIRFWATDFDSPQARQEI